MFKIAHLERKQNEVNYQGHVALARCCYLIYWCGRERRENPLLYINRDRYTRLPHCLGRNIFFFFFFLLLDYGEAMSPTSQITLYFHLSFFDSLSSSSLCFFCFACFVPLISLVKIAFTRISLSGFYDLISWNWFGKLRMWKSFFLPLSSARGDETVPGWCLVTKLVFFESENC